MKIVYQVTVTDEDVRQNVLDMVDELEEDGWIEFPNDEAREVFITDCAEVVCDKCEDDYYDAPPKREDYRNEVLDLAREYGYTTED